MTMRDYLHYLWNNPKAGQSPYKMFGGVMKPAGFDTAGDIVYLYDESKTFVNCIESAIKARKTNASKA